VQWVMMNEEVLIKNAVKNCTIMSEEITKECFGESLLHRCVNSTCSQSMANLGRYPESEARLCVVARMHWLASRTAEKRFRKAVIPTSSVTVCIKNKCQV
jgi:hypothetical protein